MDEKLQEDWLDARLREEAPYIDDAGFTSRVVHKLPARQVRRSYRAIIMIGITVAACLAGGCLAESLLANVAAAPTNNSSPPHTTSSTRRTNPDIGPIGR